MNNLEIDLRLMSFATLGKKLEKTLNNDKTKTAIRNGEVTYKFADYCKVSLGKQHFTHYKKDGEEIEIDTKSIIAQYCKENGIEIIDETKDDYKVTFTPSEKAVKEYNKMLTEQEESQYKNIAKLATQMKDVVK